MIDLIFSDDDIEMTEQEAKALDAIMASDCEDIVGLIVEAGYDAETFFEHGNWERVDFRGSNVAGVSFRGANMSRVRLYRDQLETVRQSGPTSLHKAEIQEDRAGGRSTKLTTILDRPISPAEARADFKRALDELVATSLQGEKIDFNSIVPFVPPLEVPLGRLWGLQLFLEEFPQNLPSVQLLESFSNGFTANARTAVGETTLANSLMSICQQDNLDDRVKVLEAQTQKHAEIERRLQRKLADIAKNLFDINRIVRAFLENGWVISTFLFDALAQRLKSMEDIAPFLKLMEEAKVKPDATVFSKLAQRTKGMEDIAPFLKLMEEAKVKPERAVFSTLAERTKSMEDIAPFLKLMEEASVKPEPVVFSTLAQLSKSMEDIAPFLKLMEEASVKPNATVFSMLAQRTKSMEDIAPFLKLMEEAKVKPEPAVFSTLAERTKGMEDIAPFLKLMEEAKVKPDATVFSKLAERLKGMEDVTEYRGVLQKYKIPETATILSAFVGACSSVDEAEEFLLFLGRMGQAPDNVNLNKLLANAQTSEHANAAWNLFHRFGTPRDHFTYNTFINKQGSWENAWRVFTECVPPGIRPDGHTLSHLLSKSRSRQQVKQVFDALRPVRPNPAQLQSLLRSSCSDSDVLWGFSQFRKRGLNPIAVDPETLGDQAERFMLLLKKIR